MKSHGLRVKSSIRNGTATGTELNMGVPTSRPAREIRARPTCAVCNKPVESFTEEEGWLDKFLVFTAKCHGATETVKLDVETMVGQSIDFGLAFVPTNQLPAPAVRGLLEPPRKKTGHGQD